MVELNLNTVLNAITSSLLLYLIKTVLNLDKKIALLEQEIEHLRELLKNCERDSTGA